MVGLRLRADTEKMVLLSDDTKLSNLFSLIEDVPSPGNLQSNVSGWHNVQELIMYNSRGPVTLGSILVTFPEFNLYKNTL